MILFVSCGKTTKSRLSNDWKVDKFSIVYNFDGDIYTTQGDSKSFVNEKFDMTGTIQTNEITFSRNGTYSQRIKYNATDGDDYTIDLSIEGVWTFLNANKSTNTKKNEKIQLSMTKMQGIYSEYGDELNVNYSEIDMNESEYGVLVPGGDGVLTFCKTFLIKSSTNKKLVIYSSGGNQHTAFYQQENNGLNQTYQDFIKQEIELELIKK